MFNTNVTRNDKQKQNILLQDIYKIVTYILVIFI